MKLGWQGQSGKLTIREKGTIAPLAELPGQFSKREN